VSARCPASRGAVFALWTLVGCGPAASVVGSAPGPDASDVVAPQEVTDALGQDSDPRDVASEPVDDLAPIDVADDARADVTDAATPDAADVVEMDAPREDRPFAFPDLAPILVDLPMDLGPEAPPSTPRRASTCPAACCSPGRAARARWP
jgi:hypothetical protein